MKTRITSMILAAVMLLALAACGNSGKSTGGSPSDAATFNPAGPSFSAGSAATPEPTPEPDYRLSKVLSAGQTIWFEVEKPGKGKDAEVERIYVFEPDGTVVDSSLLSDENGHHYTLGQMEQMEDAEIIALARESYEALVTYSIDHIIMDQDDFNLFSDLCMGIYQQAEGRMPTKAELLEMLGYYWYKDQRITDVMAQEVSDAIDQCWPEFAASYAVPSDSVKDMQKMLDAYTSYCWSAGGGPVISLSEYLSDFVTSSQERLELAQTAYDALMDLSKAVRSVLLDVDPELAEARNNIQPIQYKLAITTDSTGNNTKSMVLAFYNPNPSHDFPISSKTVSPLTIDGIQVYDSYYSGYQLAYSCLLCRTDRNVSFQLDGLDGSDLPVDVSAEDLFG